MKRLFTPAALAAMLVPFAVMAQSTPGQINDPSTYRGSMANQQAEQAAAAQQAAANQAMQQRLDQNYAAYAPKASGGGGGGGGRSGPPPLKSHPLLPAAKNPLLGMWRMGAAKGMNLDGLFVFPGTEQVVNGALGGACASVLGKPDTVIRFTPTALNWVAPDGHDEILNHVEYRSDGANIIVIPSDGDLALIFGMPNKDNAVAAFFGCTMSRTNTSARLGQTAAANTGGGGAAAVPMPANQGILAVTVGEMLEGRFSAVPAGTQIFVSTQNPDANLVQAGFTPDPGAPPIEKLFAACNLAKGGVQERCNVAMRALTAGTIGAVQTDSEGRGKTPALTPGRYYLVGFVPYKGHTLLWHLPVDVKAGQNAVTLNPQNGSISH
jgi:hypothetical protein